MRQTDRTPIRIIFFDIDGTIKPIGEERMRPAVETALRQVKARGVRLFIATGRTPFGLPEVPEDLFDGGLCFNGGYCYDRDGVIYEDALPPEAVRGVVENGRRLGVSVMAATARMTGCAFDQQSLRDYAAMAKINYQVLPEFERFLEEQVYQMMAGVPEALDEALIAGVPGVKTARWWTMATDIIPIRCGKAVGIQHVTERYGIRREEVMAVGDGGNDLDMIEYAGVGVAMGNAAERVKRAADYVAGSCEEDGVVEMLRHFALL